MQSLIDNWLGWLTGLGTIAAIIPFLSWIPGIGTVLTLAGSALQAISPLINGILTLIIWIWANILFPGIRNIVTSATSVATVILLVGGLSAYYRIKIHNLERQVNAVQVAYQTKRDVEPIEQETFSPGKLFPWNW